MAFQVFIDRWGKLRKFGRLFQMYDDRSGWNTEPLHDEVRARLGFYWRPDSSPFASKAPNDEGRVLDLIEVFHDLTELTNSGAEYTRLMNELLDSFAQPFELVDGEVRQSGSEVLDELLEELPTDDKELRVLLARAGKDFFYAKEDRRLQGLEAIS